MKVVQINCVYDYGSTGKITRDIHKGLQKQEIESVVLYGRRQRNREMAVYKTCTEFEAKAWNVLSRLTGHPYAMAPFGTWALLRRLKKEKPDVVHLQCINGFFVNIYCLLNYLKRNHIPTILTLHAEFMYTGNCGYAFECSQWKTGCLNCCDSKAAISTSRKSAAAWNWKQMKRAFDGFENLIICPVSDWVGGRAIQSPILNQYPIYTVLNGIDTNVFRYREEEAAELRKRLRIGEQKIILHVTADYANPVKGGKFITELSKRLDTKEYTIVVVDGQNNSPPEDFCGVYYGRANDQDELAAFYSMADVMVITSKKETFSMVCAESLCCGTPIVGFKAGGPEQIVMQEYGLFCDFGSIDELVNLLKERLKMKHNKSHLAEMAANRYSTEAMVKTYIELYQKVAEA